MAYYDFEFKPKKFLKSNFFISKQDFLKLAITRFYKLNGKKVYNCRVSHSYYDTFYVYKNLVIASCSPFVNVKKPIRIYEFY